MARGGVDGVSELCVARACMAIYMQHVCTMYVRHHSALVTCRRCCCAPGLRWRRTCSDGRLTNALAAQWRWTMLQPFHYQCRLERDPECSLYRQAGVNTRACVLRRSTRVSSGELLLHPVSSKLEHDPSIYSPIDMDLGLKI